MKLAELFDSKTEKLKWQKGQDRWNTNFDIDGLPFSMFIALDELPDGSGKKGWEVAFGIDSFKLKRVKKKSAAIDKLKGKRWTDTHGILGTGNQGQVFSTVIAGLKEFVKSVKPEYISFSADESSRMKLYRRMYVS